MSILAETVRVLVGSLCALATAKARRAAAKETFEFLCRTGTGDVRCYDDAYTVRVDDVYLVFNPLSIDVEHWVLGGPLCLSVYTNPANIGIVVAGVLLAEREEIESCHGGGEVQ